MSLVGFDVFSREYSLEAISPITAEMSAPDIPQKEVVKRTETIPNCEDLSFFEKLLKLFLPNHVPCVDSEEPVDTDDDTTADDEMTTDDETGETEDSQTQEAEGLINMSSPWLFPVAGIAVLAGMYIYFKRD
jgi:hypothetical protein